MKKRVRYRPGDFFLVPFEDGTAALGQILLDVFRIRKNSQWPESHMMGLSGGGLLVGYSCRVFPSTLITDDILASEPIEYTEFVDHRDILQGEVQIIGYRSVRAQDLDFPEFVSNFGMSKYWEKGLVRIQVPKIPLDEMLPRNKGCPAIASSVIGTPRRLLKENKSPADYLDLRYHQSREEILRFAGLTSSMTYDQMVPPGGWTAKRILDLHNTAIPR